VSFQHSGFQHDALQTFVEGGGIADDPPRAVGTQPPQITAQWIKTWAAQKSTQGAWNFAAASAPITRVAGVTPAHSHVFPGGTTRTITAAGAIAVGDLLIVGGGAGQDGAVITAVTDDLGNTYTRHSLGAGSRTAWIAYCISGFAGTPVVSATKASAGGWSFGFAAFSGATVTGVVDGGGASGSSTTGSDGITTTSAGSLVIGAYTDESTNTTAITETYGTLISEYEDGGDTWRGSLIFSIEASTGTYTPSWTLATSSPWAVYTLAFAPAAAPSADNPPSRQDYSAARSQWGQTWRAQTKAPNAGWNFDVAVVDDPAPRQDYSAARSQWKQGWNAQTKAPNAGWNFQAVDNPPSRQDYSAGASQWKQGWNAQTKAPNAGWNFQAVDNPPSRQDYSAGASQWKQGWNAQSAAPNAAWNIAPDTPPQRQSYGLSQIVAQWGQRWIAQSAQSAAQNAGWNFQAVDNPPSRRDYSAGVSQWKQTWNAQTKAPNAGWNFSVAVVDDPPSRRDYSAARSQWGQGWRAQTKAPNAGWNFSVAAVDNPPPRQGFGFAQIVGHWKQDWKAQSQSQLGVLLPDATASEWITRARRRGRR